MPRIKGKDKGETDPYDGSIRSDVKDLLHKCKLVQGLDSQIKELGDLKRLWEDRKPSSCSPEVIAEAKSLFHGLIRQREEAAEFVARDIIDALQTRNIEFFKDIVGRLEAAEWLNPVDPIESRINAIWCFLSLRAVGQPRIPFPKLKHELELTLPGFKFGSDAKLRAKAKKLGVRFLAAGRPKRM